MFGALKRGFRSMAGLILVRNVVGELRPKRTLAASRGFLAAAQLSCCNHDGQFLADRTNGRAYTTMLRPSSSSSVTLCIVAKRCVLEQKVLLIAYRKSYMRNRLVTK